MEDYSRHIQEAADYIVARLGGRVPDVGIILGSGLGRLVDIISNPVTIPYRDIPHFPIATAIGHKGNFIIGELGGRMVIAMQGRFHFYEGYEIWKVTLAIRVLKTIGIQFLFVSNAAGGCNPDFRTGDLMIIRDHINLMPNPLIGPNMDEFGPRFPDMTCAYDLELQALAERTASEMGLKLRKGVYLASTGPSYETPAEVRFFRAAGADALGMSTIPEVIVARHCGLRVFGMSVITNECNTENVERNYNDGGDVVKQADIAAAKLSELFRNIISQLPPTASRG